MAKKLVFLLVTMFVLLLASVTAFAVDTEASTPETGFTKDKADKPSVTTEVSISVSDLESEYGDLFFSEDSNTEDKFVSFKFNREYTISGLRYNATGTFTDSVKDPVVILMYIKVDGEYVPLNDVDTNSNLSEGNFVSNAKVDLHYLGNDKVNDIRIIAFSKKDAKNLDIKKIQVTDIQIVARPWTLGEKVKITINEVKDALIKNPSAP